MISGDGLCWQHVGGVGSTTTTTTKIRKQLKADLRVNDIQDDGSHKDKNTAEGRSQGE